MEESINVKVTKAGDTTYRVGETPWLDDFLMVVEQVLKNGGEMPTAVLLA